MDPSLAREAEVFARYIIGRSPSPAEIERYARGAHTLHGGAAPGEARVVDFAVRRRLALPFLDGACGLMDPDSLLRRKLILMLAILETSPGHADAFEPVTGSRASVVARLLLRASLGAFKCLAGVPLLLLVRKVRR